jgi:hypothetical protein
MTATLSTETPRVARQCMTEADKFGAFARRIMRAYGRRVADRDIEGLKGLVDLRTELDDQIRASAKALQEQGYSWAEIGRVLGISKQAAQQRFGK